MYRAIPPGKTAGVTAVDRRLLCVLSLLACLHVEPVLACATCLAGDPTITTMGTEKPFAGRLRGSVEYLARGERVGMPAVNEHEIDEQRITYSVSYASSEQWIFAASVPLITKEVTRFDLSREQGSGVGDTDLSARRYIGRSDEMPARDLWGVQVGVRVPTSSEQTSSGVAIDFDAQPGAGATIPNLGIWYGHFRMPWFFYASAGYQHAIDTGYQGYRGGDALLLTGHAQYALDFHVALRFSLDARWRGQDRYFGITDADSGGMLIMATPGLAWTPLTDLVISTSYQVPAVEHLRGRQDEEPHWRVGITYDF